MSDKKITDFHGFTMCVQQCEDGVDIVRGCQMAAAAVKRWLADGVSGRYEPAFYGGENDGGDVVFVKTWAKAVRGRLCVNIELYGANGKREFDETKKAVDDILAKAKAEGRL